MSESPFTCIKQVSCVGVLKSIVTNYFLRNTVLGKDLLHIVDKACDSVLSLKFRFKVFGYDLLGRNWPKHIVCGKG